MAQSLPAYSDYGSALFPLARHSATRGVLVPTIYRFDDLTLLGGVASQQMLVIRFGYVDKENYFWDWRVLSLV